MVQVGQKLNEMNLTTVQPSDGYLSPEMMNGLRQAIGELEVEMMNPDAGLTGQFNMSSGGMASPQPQQMPEQPAPSLENQNDFGFGG